MSLVNALESLWSSLIKRLHAINTLFSARAYKLGGVNDFNNHISGDFIFVAPNKIVFPGEVPVWMYTSPTSSKWFRITLGGGGNGNAIFQYLSHSGSTVTVTQNSVVNFTGFSTIDGRIWAVINDPYIAKPTSTGSTMFNVHNRQSTTIPGDGSGVSVSFAEHYHDEFDPETDIPEIIMHKRNGIAEIPSAPGGCTGKIMPIGPFTVVDRKGRVIRVRKKTQQPVDKCYPISEDDNCTNPYRGSFSP